MSALRRNFSWNTTKREDGSYSFRVYEIIARATPNAEGHYADSVTVKTGTRTTRPQAVGVAKRWVRFFRSGGQLPPR